MKRAVTVSRLRFGFDAKAGLRNAPFPVRFEIHDHDLDSLPYAPQTELESGFVYVVKNPIVQLNLSVDHARVIVRKLTACADFISQRERDR